MSKKYSFEEFCVHYNLDRNDDSSTDDYSKYLDQLNFFNTVTSENITLEAIQKASQ